jgi:hypothetical protein
MADASLHNFADIWHCRHLRPFKNRKDRDISTLELAGVPCFVKRYRKRGNWRLPWSGAEGSEVEWAGTSLLRRAGRSCNATDFLEREDSVIFVYAISCAEMACF